METHGQKNLKCILLLGISIGLQWNSMEMRETNKNWSMKV